ncbi:hypothetical protein BKA70DRAFT_1253327 [Coprinopsis sp. MPI-PUGE-AT-0042]|nr:hypothetical protein BKA70DRAFT_1253327 [Coprinopsis sp. MPI-PUGE-AT-0042]
MTFGCFFVFRHSTSPQTGSSFIPLQNYPHSLYLNKMQFHVLVSFFFAYIAAVQASPVQLPNIPSTETVNPVELPNLPRDLPAGVAGSIPVEFPDVTGTLKDIAFPIPVPRRSLTEILKDVTLPIPVPREVTETVEDIASLKVASVVDTVAYEASPIVGLVGGIPAPPLPRRQVPSAPSTEGIIPEVKVPTVPEVPSLPNVVPAVPVGRRQVEVPKVSAPKMVRVVRRQAPGCADRGARRQSDSLDNTPSVPEVPAIPEVPEVPSVPDVETPSLPTL